MQKSMPFAIPVTVMAAIALSLGGCATKGFVRQQVSVEDGKLQATDTQVAAQGSTPAKRSNAPKRQGSSPKASSSIPWCFPMIP